MPRPCPSLAPSLRALVAAVLVLTFLPGLAPRADASSIRLTQAIEAYWKADYDTAEALLQKIQIDELDRPEQIRLYQYLGLTLIAKDRTETAEQRFADLLELDPNYEMSEREFPPAVLAVFENARRLLAGRLYDKAVEIYTASRFDEAVEILQRAQSLDDTDPLIRELLGLAREQQTQQTPPVPVEPPPPACQPSRSWGTVQTRHTLCEGAELTRLLKDDTTATPPSLPAPANRITVVYANHNFGVGECWKLVFFDTEGQPVYTFDDPQNLFADEDTPSLDQRWLTVDLPEVVQIGYIVLHAEDRYDVTRTVLKGFRRTDIDQFLISLEVVCP